MITWAGICKRIMWICHAGHQDKGGRRVVAQTLLTDVQV